MPVFAYADETIFNVNSKNTLRALGCGILICKTEIVTEVIQEAITNLSNDPDFDKRQDRRTLERNYFHASDDSKNAHSHICNSINKHIKAIFDFTYYDNILETLLNNSTHVEGILKRCLTSSTIEFFNYPEEVFLIIEKRDQLNKTQIKEWKDFVYRLFEGASYNIPSYKTYFPKINILLEGKSSPGLQVVDFLLWSVSRSKKSPKNTIWMKRLLFKTWHYYKDDDEHNRGQYFLNSMPDVHLKATYDLPFQKPREWNEILHAYINIEKFLRHIDKTDFTELNSFIWEEYSLLINLIKDNSQPLKYQDIENIGRLFIRLFDKLPLYSNVKTDEEWRLMFHAKYLAAMLTRNGQIHLNRTKNELLRWRYKMQAEYPIEFMELMK